MFVKKSMIPNRKSIKERANCIHKFVLRRANPSDLLPLMDVGIDYITYCEKCGHRGWLRTRKMTSGEAWQYRIELDHYNKKLCEEEEWVTD